MRKKLFSTWEEDYKKEVQDYLEELDKHPNSSGWGVIVRKKRRDDGSLKRMQETGSYINSKNTYDKTIKLVENNGDHDYHRLSRPEIERVKKSIEKIDLIGNDENKGYKSQEFIDEVTGLSERLNNLRITNKYEKNIAKSGYDDKYSSKLAERLLKKKIDENSARKIAQGRSNVDKKYKRDKEGNFAKVGLINEAKRHWRDAGIVYDSALDRSLNKDAAMVAAGTAALGAGAYALHKHLKKKRK